MRIVIDRFEGTQAILLFGESGLNVPVPRALLPAEAVEGDWLTVEFQVDRQATEAQRAKIRDMLQRLKDKTD
jgi:hypothetical protein